MEVFIREIEKKDYPAVLSLWNDEIGNTWVTAQNIAPHYDREKNDENWWKGGVSLKYTAFVYILLKLYVGQELQLGGSPLQKVPHMLGHERPELVCASASGGVCLLVCGCGIEDK